MAALSSVFKIFGRKFLKFSRRKIFPVGAENAVFSAREKSRSWNFKFQNRDFDYKVQPASQRNRRFRWLAGWPKWPQKWPKIVQTRACSPRLEFWNFQNFIKFPKILKNFIKFWNFGNFKNPEIFFGGKKFPGQPAPIFGAGWSQKISILKFSELKKMLKNFQNFKILADPEFLKFWAGGLPDPGFSPSFSQIRNLTPEISKSADFEISGFSPEKSAQKWSRFFSENPAKSAGFCWLARRPGRAL